MKKNLLSLLLCLLGIATAQQETFEFFKWNQVQHPLDDWRRGAITQRTANQDSKGRQWSVNLVQSTITLSNNKDTSKITETLPFSLKSGYNYYINSPFVDEFDTKILHVYGYKYENSKGYYENHIVKIDSMNQGSYVPLSDLVQVDSTVRVGGYASINRRLVLSLSNNSLVWESSPVATVLNYGYSGFYTDYVGTIFAISGGQNGFYTFHANGSYQNLLSTEKIVSYSYHAQVGKLSVYTPNGGYQFQGKAQQSLNIPFYQQLSKSYTFGLSTFFKSGITAEVLISKKGFNVKEGNQSTTFLFAQELQGNDSLQYAYANLQEDSSLMLIYWQSSPVTQYIDEIFVFRYKNGLSKLVKRIPVAPYQMYTKSNVVGYAGKEHLYVYADDYNKRRILQFKDDVVTDIPYKNSNCSNYIVDMATDQNYLWISNEANADSPCAVARMVHDTYFVKGRVFYDMNANGTKETTELWYDKIKLVAKPSGLILLPDLLGNFAFQGEAGTAYAITVSDSSQYISIKTETTTGYIGVKLKEEKPEVGTSFWLPRARCGTNRPSTFSLHNHGVVPVQEVVIRLIPQNMQLLKDNVLVDTAVFTHQNLAAGQYASVDYNIEWPDASQVGQTATLKTITELYVGGVLASTKEDSIQTIIRCSYDPNDKSVTPVGLGDDAYTLKKNALKYVIRFENTGNDTAYHIVVKDTLSHQLDWSTFEVVGASHRVNTEFSVQGIVSFHFNNIMLPDTGASKEKAQGYVSFTIRPKSDVAENTLLCNGAAIYFDENPPIITNRACNTLVEKLPTIVGITDIEDQSLSLYPNPAQDWVQLANDAQVVILYSTLGEEVLRTPEKKLDLIGLPNGVYMVKTTHQNGKVSTAKLSIVR